MIEPVNRCIEWTVLSDPSNGSDLRERIEAFLHATALEDEVIHDLVLAVQEAFANTVVHAYEGKVDGKIDVRVEELGDRIEIRLRDYGRKSDRAQLKPRDLKKVRPGGLGIHFMQCAADEVRFDTTLEEGTEVILIKHLHDEAMR